MQRTTVEVGREPDSAGHAAGTVDGSTGRFAGVQAEQSAESFAIAVLIVPHLSVRSVVSSFLCFVGMRSLNPSENERHVRSSSDADHDSLDSIGWLLDHILSAFTPDSLRLALETTLFCTVPLSSG